MRSNKKLSFIEQIVYAILSDARKGTLNVNRVYARIPSDALIEKDQVYKALLSLVNKKKATQQAKGQFKATIKCLSCKFTSVKFDAFMFLSLPIPATGKATLENCLNLFQQTEKLTGNDRWTCPKVIIFGLIDGARPA